MSKIKQISAREILNAKGSPTVEATVILDDGKSGTASVPSGTSVGTYEAAELKDADTNRYQGQGVLKAVSNIENAIAPALLGIDVTKQPEIDKKMIDLDGTQNKSRLGANAILAVSMAVAKAAANSSSLPLFLYLREFIKKDNVELKIPAPAFNILNGGKHAGNNTNIQEFLVIPVSSKPFNESLQIGVASYNALRKILETNNLSTLVGDEGGFGPRLQSNQAGLAFVKQAMSSLNLRLGFDIFLGLDAAASNFYINKKYQIKDKPEPLEGKDLISYYQGLDKEFHILYMEDPLAEDDWDNWAKIYSEMGQHTLIIGDDLIATNPYRLQMALDKKAITGIIIKPNQIGSVIEAIAVVEVARAAGIKIVVSHRSGETNDDFIADFAVAVSADYTKFGAPQRGERMAKYNRLLEIENLIKSL